MTDNTYLIKSKAVARIILVTIYVFKIHNCRYSERKILRGKYLIERNRFTIVNVSGTEFIQSGSIILFPSYQIRKPSKQ